MGPTLLLTRWRAGGDLRRVLPAIVGALLVGVGVLVAPGPASTPVRLGLSMVWCVATVWRAWATRPSLLVLARDLDARAGTDGLLATALAVEQGRAHGDAGLQAQVLASAESAMDRFLPHLPRRWRWPWRSGVLSAVLVLSALMVPAEQAAPIVQQARAVVGSVPPIPTVEEAEATGKPSDIQAADLTRPAQAGGRSGRSQRRGEAGRTGASPGAEGGSGAAGAATIAGAADGEAVPEPGAQRAGVQRPDRPAGASEQLVSRPGTERGDLDDGPPIQGGNQGAFDVQGVDEDDPTNLDAEMPWSGGEASGKEGGPEADADTPPGETPNGEAANGGEGELREGTGEGQAGTPGDPADGGPAPKGGEDARSKDDSQTSGPGAGAGAGAVGTADAESDRPVALPPLPDALARIEVAWENGGDGALREVEDAALGQRSTEAWRALHADYNAVAEDTLAREALPPARADAVRRYFDALSSDAAKDEE